MTLALDLYTLCRRPRLGEVVCERICDEQSQTNPEPMSAYSQSVKISPVRQSAPAVIKRAAAFSRFRTSLSLVYTHTPLKTPQCLSNAHILRPPLSPRRLALGPTYLPGRTAHLASKRDTTLYFVSCVITNVVAFSTYH